MADEPNYYLILELPFNPPVLSPEEVKARIEQKRLEWDKNINSMGARGVIYRKYRDMIPDMLEKLADPLEIKRQWNEGLMSTYRSFKEKVAFMASEGGQITESQYKALCESFPQLSEGEMRASIVKSGIQVKADEVGPKVVLPTKPDPPVGMEVPKRDEMETLENNLSALGVSTLYEVLQCTPTSTLETLSSAAQKFKTRARKMPKGTAKADASNVISMLAGNKFFKSEAARKGFDYAWANYKASKVVSENLRFFVTGNPPTISRADYLKLIQRLREAGMSPEEAEWYVYDECCNRCHAPYPAPPSNELPPAPMRQCPHCFALNDQAAKRCCKCANWLVVSCPGCGREVEVGSRVCVCGFAVGDVPLATAALEEAKRAYARGEHEEALIAAETALLYWPKNAEATELSDRIKAARREVAQRRIRAVWEKVQAPATARVQENGNAGLCITWTPARLSGQVIADNRIPLPNGEMAGISFCVVRKQAAIPTSAEDGLVVAKTAAMRMEDASLTPGVVYGYAVFLMIDGTTTDKGISCGKGIVTAPPQDLSLTPGDGKLTLRWKEPAAALGTVILRQRQGAPDAKDGHEIRLQGNTAAYIDTELCNGTEYNYLVRHLFRNAEGTVVSGPGASVSGEPVAEPPSLPLSSWQAKTNDGELALFWQEPQSAHDAVNWYLTEEPMGAAGTLLPHNHPSLHMVAPLSGLDARAHRGRVTLAFKGVRYLTPVVVLGRAAMVCENRPVSAHPGVQGLAAQRSQGRLILTWQWPDACDSVLVLYDKKGYPDNVDAEAGCARMQYDRHRYEMTKGCIINNVGDDALYLAVYALIKHGTQTFRSSVQHLLSVGAAAKQRISYQLVCKKTSFFFGKKTWHLVISSDRPGIPPFQVRCKHGASPLNRNDGVLVLTTPACEGRALSMELSPTDCAKGTCFSIFLADALQSQLYAVNHRPTSELTIS